VFAHIGSSDTQIGARVLASVILAFALLVPGRAAARDSAGDPPTGILLAQTGWTSSANDIAAARLKSEYCAGRVQKTTHAAASARQIFACDAGAETVGAQAFRTQSKDRIILVDLAEAIPLMKTLTVDGVSFFRDPARYPLTLPASPAPPLTHMIMTGTTAISRYSGRSADQYGPAVLTEKVAPYFQSADFVHISNEVSFMDRCAFEAGLKFCSKQTHFQAFKDIHVNVVELTGNHNRDFGNAPMLATLAWFRQNGMRTFGGGTDEADANRPIFLDLKGGGAIGMIGFNELCPLAECAAGQTPGANRFKLDKARAAIRDMKAKRPDAFIIVTVQFGEDSSYRPTSSQHSISLALVEAGADLVFGSQAHQVQQMELHQGKVILYGLGNFLFDQIHATGVRQGYFMNLYFLRGRLAAMEPVFTWIDEKRRPAIATDEQAAAIRKAIYADALLYK
jgi:poly-gamma-glutamate capsule biosynthesis protein CapA/YwtB (metallophosphatase superfamily)